MSIAKRVVLCAAICALSAVGAAADTVLTFEGLQNFEQVSQYYAGGTGSLGSGPGPSDGITITRFGLAYIPGLQTGNVTPFPGDPSPPTVLLLFDPSNPFGAGVPLALALDVSAGFTGSISFYDIAIGRAGSVQVYDGPDGTGNLLAQETLPITPEAFASSPTVLGFSGIARSVVFSGGNDQLALDNIAFPSILPEPSSWILMAAGLAGSLRIISRRRSAVSAR